MSRSGYSDDCEYLNIYRATVQRAINGKRGQAFLLELAKAMDAMPIKRLIADELISGNGEVCAIGVVCKARGIDVTDVQIDDAHEVGRLIGVSSSMAAEIEYQNDEGSRHDETPEQRWLRIRKWVNDNLRGQFQERM